MSIDFTQSIEHNQAAAAQARFANLIFSQDVQMLEFAKAQTAAIFKFDVLPVNDTLAYGRAAIHQTANASFVCPQHTFGQPCPICELIRQRRDDTEFWQNNHAKEKAFLNVVPLTEDGMPHRLHQDHTHPVYCYSVGSSQKAKSGFWKLLTSALSSPADEDRYKRLFADWQQGLTLKLMLTPAEMRGRNYMEVSGIEFIPRKMQYDKAQWAPLCYQFMDIFKCLDYDTIKTMAASLNDSPAPANAGGYSPHIGGTTDNRPDGIYPPSPQQQYAPQQQHAQTAPPMQPPAAPQLGGFYAPQQGQYIPQQQQQMTPPMQPAPPQQGGFYAPQPGVMQPPQMPTVTGAPSTF